MARTQISSGVCGFVTTVVAKSEDQQNVTLSIESDCPSVMGISKQLNARTFDAFQEIGPCKQQASMYDTKIMSQCSKLPHVACPVPSGICKAIEVAAGLALPRDAHIKVSAED